MESHAFLLMIKKAFCDVCAQRPERYRNRLESRKPNEMTRELPLQSDTTVGAVMQKGADDQSSLDLRL